MTRTEYNRLASGFNRRIQHERTGVQRRPDPKRPQHFIPDPCPYCGQAESPCRCDAPYPGGDAA